MRKLLIINNGTIHLIELEKAFSNFQLTVVNYSDIEPEEAFKFDLIILTGSSHIVFKDNKDFVKEIEIINKSSKPIIGICFGFELISFTFNAKLREIDKKERGIFKIIPLKDNPIFKGVNDFEVFEAHRWVVSEVSSDIEPLAYSNEGIEIIKINNRNIYGFQFHPEVMIDRNCGFQILENLLNIIGINS